MRAFFTENRNLIIAGSISAFLIAGSGLFLYKALERNTLALNDLQEISGKLTKIESSTPSPTAENLSDLHSQKEDAKRALEHLTADLKALDLPVQEMAPPEFQKTLNERAQSLAKLAESYGILIPANFYLNFDRYSKSVPKPEVTPLLGRQLQVATLLSEMLFKTGPTELKTFERTEFDLERDPSVAAKEATAGKDKDKAKDKDKEKPKPKTETQKPLLTGQSFKLQFVTRPASLREFLNNLASQKTCLLVTRSLKVENEKQKGPAKRGPEGEGLLAAGAAPTPNALGGSPAENVPGVPGAPVADVGQFIVGDEKIEVTIRVELVSFLEELAKRP
jgi:hypothetical protein